MAHKEKLEKILFLFNNPILYIYISGDRELNFLSNRLSAYIQMSMISEKTKQNKNILKKLKIFFSQSDFVSSPWQGT